MEDGTSGLLLEFEEPCPICKGEGCWRMFSGDWHYCENCDGAGYIPTEFGEKVLQLMRHNFRPMLRDATDDD